MLFTDVGHALQLFPAPHATSGIVRVAEQEDGGLLVGTGCLKVLPVDFKVKTAAHIRLLRSHCS